MSVLSDLLSGHFAQAWADLQSEWEGSDIGHTIDSAAAAAWTELKAIAPVALESVAEAGTAAILVSLGAGAPTSKIIAAGVAAAEAAFSKQGVTVASTTLTTFTSALHNAVVSTSTAPAAVSAKPTAVPAPAAA